ncbi:MAG: hypothetical protein ABEJ83_00450 [Candidatus Nanohaloarchaea archaeon]
MIQEDIITDSSFSRRGLAEMIGFVFIFFIVIMLALMFFLLNSVADNNQSASANTEVGFQADKIRIRSTVTRLMVDKLWRSEEVSYGDYGDEKAYRVMSKYLSTSPGSHIWLNGTSIDYSTASDDLEYYIETVMNQSYGNRPYKVELANRTGTELSVGSISSHTRVSYPIALKESSGRIRIYVESGDVLNVR